MTTPSSGKKAFAGEFIRCQHESDVFVVNSVEDAHAIAGKIKNPCHNHQIVIRASYEKAVSAAVREFAERARGAIHDHSKRCTCPPDISCSEFLEHEIMKLSQEPPR